MNLRNISIKSRFFLLLCGSVLFWLLTGLIILSLIRSITAYHDTATEISSLPEQTLRLENSVQIFLIHDLSSDIYYESGRSEGISRFNDSRLEISALLRNLKIRTELSNELLMQQKLDHCLEYLGNAGSIMEDLVEKSRIRGQGDYGLSGTLKDQMEDIDFGFLPGYEQAGQELIRELQAYLMLPGTAGLNSLLNRLNNLEAVLSGFTNNQEGNAAALGEFSRNLRSFLELEQELGTSRYEGSRSRIFSTISILHQETLALVDLFNIRRDAEILQHRWVIIAIILASALLYGALLSLLGRSIDLNLRILGESSDELAAGRIPGEIAQKGYNEFSRISGQMSRFFKSLENKAGFAADLAEGIDPEPFEPLGPDDSLANSLINLEKNLLATKTEEEKHRKSRGQRRWANEGIAKFGEILRIYNEDISILSENVIRELVNYLDASAGGIFLLNDKEENPELELVASFAFERKKYLKKLYSPGEGLIGTCAIEKEKIFLTEIPEDYVRISSGLGEGKPSCLLLMPLQLEDVNLGVIEIASLRVFAEFEIEFIENLAGSIASSVLAVKMNMRTAQLLEQSQNQAKEMAKQEEIMRQNMEELQATQEESARRESEISGILNGIHNSSHVAEFNMDEELISINDKFLQLLGSQRTQMLNRKFHEILGTSRHTEEYRQFWQELKDGKTVSRIDKVPVLTGEAIWLRQTFTPIPDNEGNPFKVLNIAADITETVEQKESLEKQSNEIRRANIEMQTFSDAVDKALIKCVYSPAGQILELNGNYEQATGFTEKEMMGKNNRVFLQRVEKEQFDKIWEDILKDKTYSGVIRRTKPTGEEVWLMSTFTPVKDENGNIFKVFFLGQDITERKLKYQLLEEANKEIDRLRKQLDGRA